MAPIFDKVQKFATALKSHLTPENLVSMEACLDCRSCGTACAWFLTTQEEKYLPVNRKKFIYSIYKRFLTPKGRILGALGVIHTPTDKELEESMENFWDCTACGRCSIACPLGLNNREITRLARKAFCDIGLSEKNPIRKGIVENTRDKRHSFGLSPEQIFLRIGFFLAYDGVDIPIEVQGAEYLFICPTVGNTKFPDIGVKLPKILNQAGLDYTVSTRLIDTGTEIDHIVCHKELSKRMLMEIEDEAERLAVEKVIVAECGCDVRTFYIEAKNLLGRPFKFPIVSIDSLFIEFIKDEKIPIKKITDSITLHDPCYIVRLSGLGEMERKLVNLLAENFIEMTPNHEQNYCCNGGAGPMRLPEKAEIRRKVSSLKAKQIRETKADLVVTPCAVCMLSLTDICNHYQLSKKNQPMVLLMFELVYRAMARGIVENNSFSKMGFPAPFQGKNKEYVEEHSLAGYLEDIKNLPEKEELFVWLQNDEIVQRFLRKNGDAEEYLNNFLEGFR